MDMNFADFKKEAAVTAENIYNEAADKTQQAAYDLIGGAGQQDDNAHTEQFFSNDQKEHVDPQTFVQRMSAGAKEAQVQLDAKFAKPLEKEMDNIFASAVDKANELKQDIKEHVNINDITKDFMNAERGGSFDFVPNKISNEKPKEPEVPTTLKSQVDDKQMSSFEQPKKDEFEVPSAPLAEFKETHPQQQILQPEVLDQKLNSNFYDDGLITGFATATVNKINKDSDTESPSISYTPSPAKKMNAEGTLKEQDNDKFISTENLLVDIKDERTGTPEFQKASSTIPAPTSTFKNTSNTVTTDLDDEDDDHAYGMPEMKTSKPLTDAVNKDTLPAFSSKAEIFEDFIMPSKEEPIPSTSKAFKKPNTSALDETFDSQHPKLLSVEQLFYKYGLDAWFKPERLHPQVESLIYWRDVKKSGIVFGAGVTTILAISCFSVISVFAWLSLMLLTGALAFRLYKNVMQAIQKTSDGHPFEEFLKFDLTISQEKVQQNAGVAVAHINGFIAELRRLFLVEDIVDSIKFGILLWVMTYIGAWLNGMTLVLLAFISLFTLPKLYENNKESIDTYVDLVLSKITEVSDKVKAALPMSNKKPIAAESDKDK